MKFPILFSLDISDNQKQPKHILLYSCIDLHIFDNLIGFTDKPKKYKNILDSIFLDNVNGRNIHEIYKNLCRRGELKTIKWISSIIECENTIYDYHETACCFAIYKGHVDILKWLHSIYNFKRDNELIPDCIKYAAEYGYMAIFKWLHSTFKLTREEIIIRNNKAFRFAAQYGHLNVCKWLHSTFGLTKKDALSFNNYAFLWAIHNGHLNVCKWLYETYNLKEEDIELCGKEDFIWVSNHDSRIKHAYAFQWSVHYCQWDICIWLYETFKLTKEDIIIYKHHNIVKKLLKIID